MNNINLITVLGPTATGKTNLAVNIAQHIPSEIISADSRQIYKGMDIGTGKDLAEYSVNGELTPYHLIDIINPSEDYSVYTFQREFHKIYNNISKKNKIPILCGGTGLYIESVLLNYEMSDIKPNQRLREDLEKLSKDELLILFKDINPKASKVWKCDTKQRIIRGIEIASSKDSSRSNKSQSRLDLSKTIVLGIKMGRDRIRERITDRLEYRLNNGMIEEVNQLLFNNVLTFERLNYFGLEYKYIGYYLNKKISYDEMFSKLNTAIHKFAKKQMTFFRRMEKRGININWIKNGNLEEALDIINSK